MFVNEIVVRSQGRDLARNRGLLCVEGNAGLDDTGTKSQRFLRIFSSTSSSSGSGIQGSNLYGTISTTDMVHATYKLRNSPGSKWIQIYLAVLGVSGGSDSDSGNISVCVGRVPSDK